MFGCWLVNANLFRLRRIALLFATVLTAVAALLHMLKPVIGAVGKSAPKLNDKTQAFHRYN